MKIVLFEPQIPQNTGNVVRTCAVTGSSLLIVEPCGFSLEDRYLKRAGLDYWENVDVQRVTSLEELIEKHHQKMYFFTTKATQSFYDVNYTEDSILVFGAETHGLPPYVREQYANRCVKIPMRPGVRCLNLATSVGIAVYQAYRNFPHLLTKPLS